MNIFLKLLTECALLVMLATFTESKITSLTVQEGDVAFLNFSYSCNSTKVTLQYSYRAPFYNSRSPITHSSFSNLKLRNETDGEACFLCLTIDPVTKDDAGGYILFAYKDDPTQVEDDRIWLVVGYPPGEASCSLSEEYFDPDWVRLQCTAPLGNVGGFIMCYQNGIKIPPLNPPQQHVEILSQTLLAKVGHLVYCCSCTVGQTKDMCECKDSVWDPIQNKQVTNATDPCPPTVTTVQYPPFSEHSEDNEFEVTSPSANASTGTPPQITSCKNLDSYVAYISAYIMYILYIITLILVCVRFYYEWKSRQKEASELEKRRTIQF